MATLKLNSQTVVSESGGTLTAPALNITTGTLASGVTLPANHVVQVKQQKSAVHQEITGNINTMVNISALNTSITIGPNNKVLVQGMISYASDYWAIGLKIKRGINTSTLSEVDDSKGDNTGYTNQKEVMTAMQSATTGGGFHHDEMSQINFSYLDSPAQSSSSTIHYGVFVHSRGTGSQTIQINSGYDYDDNSIYMFKGISTLTLTEIKS